MTKTRDLADLGGGFIQAGTGAMQRTVESKLQDVVSVKDFGARGNGLGTTPADEGIDITNASWNTWDGTPFKTNLAFSPYVAGGVFTPPSAKPFSNTDTWDFIGTQLALWSNSSSVYVPAGKYVINVGRVGGGLVIMRGQEQTIIGAGPYKSTFTTKENAAFFAANNVGSINAYYLIRLYRPGGPPTHLIDLGFAGPSSYGTTSNNFSLIHSENINGITFRDLWFTSAHRGLSLTTSSGDSHAKGITAEFLFGESFFIDSTSDLSIDFCNVWASSVGVTTQKGIVAQGYAAITNSRLIGYYGSPVQLNRGIFSNNTVTLDGGSAGCAFTSSCQITGNNISGTCGGPLVVAVSSCSIVGNCIKQTDQHPCLNLGNSTAASATNNNITGNTFIKTNNTVAPQNFAIIGEQSGVGYFNALTASTIIIGNTFQGRASQTPGSATMVKNTFDGVLQPFINAEAVTNTGDVFGNAIMTGTAASGSTVTITGVLGQGQGGARDQVRLNLVSVKSDGSSYSGKAFALYTSKYNGDATLIATLGSQADGGSITFGTSGANPTFVSTAGAGGTVSYSVNSIVLI